MESSGGGRRRRSLSDESIDSPDTGGVALSQKRPSPEAGNRTLLDIIRDEPGGGTHHRKTWRTFKDKIRLHRAGAAWTSSVRVPSSDVPIPSSLRSMSRRHSTRFPTDDSNPTTAVSSSTQLSSMPSSRAMMMTRHNSSRLPNLATASYGRGAEFSTSFRTVQADDRSDSEEEEEREEEERESESEEEGEPQVRMSLMALLAETDRQMGLDGSPFMMGDDDEDEDDEEEEEAGAGAGEYNNCCVCMVRHKGAAFIPCGHTFCRLCSRELFVQRGNCPLCNNFILEILDIF